MSAKHPNLIREEARSQFFELLRTEHWTDAERKMTAIEPDGLESASQVIDDLAAATFDLYKEIHSDLLAERTRLAAQRDPRGPFDGVPTFVKLAISAQRIEYPDERVVRLHELMVEWVESWDLRADWCLELGFRTLKRWCEVPLAFERRNWAPIEYALIGGLLTFQIPDWNGTIPVSEFRREGKRELAAQIDVYCEKLKQDARSLSAPHELNRHEGAAYRWTVRSQVQGQSYSEIAEVEGADASNVRTAVEQLLNFLGLPSRAKPRGRPTGSRKPIP